MELTKKDILLVYLRQNARQKLTTISKKTNIPISTLYDKLKAFQRGLITKHTSLIDFSALGYQCRALSLLKVDMACRDELKRKLLTCPNVNSLFKVNNGYDFMVESVFHTVKDLEDYLEQLGKRFAILDQNHHYVIEDVKREGFLADPDLVF